MRIYIKLHKNICVIFQILSNFKLKKTHFLVLDHKGVNYKFEKKVCYDKIFYIFLKEFKCNFLVSIK